MLLPMYVALVAVAGVLSAAGLLIPALLLGVVAGGLALRHELRWVAARRIRAPRVTMAPAPRTVPQREG